MFRFFLRITGYVALAGAFVSAVIDGVRSISGGALLMTATGDLLRSQIFEIRRLVSYVHPFLWDPLVYSILRLPVWLVLSAIGLIFFVVSVIRDKPAGFVDSGV